jgi:ribosomal protein L3 glutamine methyltransferase
MRVISPPEIVAMSEEKECPDNVGALIDWCADSLRQGGVYCGHGTANYRDEAASLIYHVAGLSHVDERAYTRLVDARQLERVRELLRRRIELRMPLAYLLQEAWFAGLRFFVDERVLVPRSPFAELIQARFEPWIGRGPVARILEIGTGSGCIAIACALAFPDSQLVATDVSAAALEVARINVRRYGLESRLKLLQADLFGGVTGRFDLIVSNPPYVPQAAVASLPTEYQHEPELALAGGPDGLESARLILQDAADYLTNDGILALEVGAGRDALETAFPRSPFVWPDLESGGEGIALINSGALQGLK